MKRILKRLVSFVLSFTLCVSLLPNMGAAKAAGEFSGSVLTLSTVDRDNDGTDDSYKLTYAMQNVQYTASYQVAFDFDMSLLNLTPYNNASIKIKTSAAIAGAIACSNVALLKDPDATYTDASWATAKVADALVNDTITGFTGFSAPAPQLTVNGNTGHIDTVLNLRADINAKAAELNGRFFNISTSGNVASYDLENNSGQEIPYELFSFYFVPADGLTMADVAERIRDTTFTMTAGGDGLDVTDGTYISYSGEGLTELGAGGTGDYRLVGFPKAPIDRADVELTIKDSANATYSGATVTLSGTNADEEAFSASATTTTGGKATFTDVPASNASGYTIAVSGSASKDGTSDGKKYTLSSPTPATLSVSGTTQITQAVAVTATELVGAYPFEVSLQDMQGNNLGNVSTAAVTLGGAVSDLTATANPITFKTAASGTADLIVSGLEGYQPRTVPLNITPVNGSADKLSALTIDSGSASNSYATAKVENGKGVVTLKLAKVATNVEIPLPVPSGDDAMSSEEVTNITANFKPTTTDAINEVGANGVTLTQDNGGIIVTIDNATKKITGIKLNATLPAGTYTVTITGNGMKTIVTTVIIKKSTDGDTIVNVGGTENEDGTITGGITGTTPDSGNTDANGNVNVDLGGGAGSNTTVTEGGTTNADGTVTGGNDLTNTGGSSGSTNTDLTPGVMSDPVYVVDMTYDNTNADDPFIMASISIKNVTGANAGTFGLEYDPKIFGGMDGKTKEQIILNMNENIEYASSADETQVVYPSDKDQPAYITVGWQMKSGKPSIGSTTKLFDIKLFGGLLFKSAIEKGDFSNASINVMPYDETVSGQRIVADAAADADMYNHLMTQNWRETALAGQLNSVHLDAALAQRGGFYQITQSSGVDGALVHHDIAMELRYPDTLTPHFAAEFLIQDKASTPNAIGGATIKVYRDSDFTTPPFAEAFNPETTKPYVTLKTSDFGRAAASVDEGKYYYTVTHPSFWDYPDGTVTTDNDGVQYDTLTVDQYGVITMQENTPTNGPKFTTSIEPVTGFINPQMEAKSYHQVSLGDMNSWTKPKATFSSLNKAYNKQDYYFSITPPSGYDWAKDMTAIATDISAVAKLHGIDKTATSAETAMYRVGAGTGLTVSWDSTRNQFKIAGAAIIGDAVGDVTFTGAVPDWYNSLRAGDIVLALTEDMFKTKDMQITVNAGEGGKVTVAEPDPARATGTSEYTPNGGTTTDLPTGSQDAVTETLKGGRTDSAEYTFKPTTEGHLIDKVVVNGIEIPLTEPQKKEFTYQFTNVSDDESIVVTFKDGAEPANPLSKPVVTVILGANGKADVTDDSAAADPASLTGPVTQIYEGTAGKAFTVTPNPTTPYVVDKIFINGEEKAFSDGETKIATLTADQMTLGATHTIIITFKDENGPSTQVVVDASVDAGLGFIYSAGIGVYSLNDTPSYTMKPYNESWYVNNQKDAKALLVKTVNGTEVDHSDKVEKDETTGLFTYTLEPLTADTILRASFTEEGPTVNGILQVAATTLEAAPAKIKFERAKSEANKTDATEFEVKTGSGVTAAKQMTFTAVVPAGEWKVTVSKQGYLDYVITGFTVSGTETKDILFGVGEDPEDGTTAKPIILTPGDAAGDGLSIGFADVAMVAAGWVADAKTPNRIKSDVDESLYGSADINRFSDSKDMTLVTNNYLNRRQYMTYDAFKTSAPTV